MSSFIDRFINRKPATAAQSAKDRLKFVLVTDRTTISPEELKKMQAEILDVIRKYCRINETDVEMKFEQRDRDNYLVADIPLASGHRSEQKGAYMRLETSLVIDESPDAPAPAGTESAAPTPPATPTLPAATITETPISTTTDTQPAPSTSTASTEGDKVQVSGAPTGLQAESKPDSSSPDKR